MLGRVGNLSCERRVVADGVVGGGPGSTALRHTLFVYRYRDRLTSLRLTHESSPALKQSFN
jgi:hypothetical protein